jgi:hypothetical protein
MENNFKMVYKPFEEIAKELQMLGAQDVSRE